MGTYERRAYTLASASVQIRQIAADEPAAIRLLRQSDEYMAELYPPDSNYLESSAALQKPNVAFFGAYVGDVLAACGALKIIDDDVIYGEIKRVFVQHAFRRKGLAQALMHRLESHAVESGIQVIKLETGVKQPEAIELYRKLGYAECPVFGTYRPDPLSVFMEKTLSARQPASSDS